MPTLCEVCWCLIGPSHRHGRFHFRRTVDRAYRMNDGRSQPLLPPPLLCVVTSTTDLSRDTAVCGRIVLDFPASRQPSAQSLARAPLCVCATNTLAICSFILHVSRATERYLVFNKQRYSDDVHFLRLFSPPVQFVTRKHRKIIINRSCELD